MREGRNEVWGRKKKNRKEFNMHSSNSKKTEGESQQAWLCISENGAEQLMNEQSRTPKVTGSRPGKVLGPGHMSPQLPPQPSNLLRWCTTQPPPALESGLQRVTRLQARREENVYMNR